MYTDEVRVRLVPRSSHSQYQASFPNKPHVSHNRWAPPSSFFFRRNVSYLIFNFQTHESLLLEEVLCRMLRNRDTGKGAWDRVKQEKMPRRLSANSASPERLFRSVGLVKSDLWGRLLDTTLIDVMWAKQATETQLERE